jgi:hypothetical protein
MSMRSFANGTIRLLDAQTADSVTAPHLLRLSRLFGEVTLAGTARGGKSGRHRFSSIASAATLAAWAVRKTARNAVAAGLGERCRNFMNAQLLRIQLS